MGRKIKTVRKFEDAIEKEIRSGGNYYEGYCYRGQVNTKWKLESSLERVSGSKVSLLDYYTKIERNKSKINAFKQGKPFEFVKLVDQFDPHGFTPNYFNLPDSNYLAYLRHYGFPTPILDWTHSRYVALYFACEDFAFSKTDGSVYLYFDPIKESGVPEGESRIVTLNTIIDLPKRHFIQQSHYLAGLRYDESNRRSEMKGNWFFMPLSECGATVSKLVIEKESKFDIIRQLREMGISRESLFMDEDSLMKGLGDEFAHGIQRFGRCLKKFNLSTK